jgi:cold shock CspA family protein
MMIIMEGLAVTVLGTLTEGQVVYFDTLRGGGGTNESFA